MVFFLFVVLLFLFFIEFLFVLFVDYLVLLCFYISKFYNSLLFLLLALLVFLFLLLFFLGLTFLYALNVFFYTMIYNSCDFENGLGCIIHYWHFFRNWLLVFFWFFSWWQIIGIFQNWQKILFQENYYPNLGKQRSKMAPKIIFLFSFWNFIISFS